MHEALITIIIALGTGLAGSFSTVVFYRNKNKAEVKQIETNTESVELDNTEKAVKIWRELAEKLSADMGQYMQEVNQLKNMNSELSQKMDELKKQLNELKCENAKLKKMFVEVNKNIKEELQRNQE